MTGTRLFTEKCDSNKPSTELLTKPGQSAGDEHKPRVGSLRNPTQDTQHEPKTIDMSERDEYQR
jgi:hypothetical protein